MVDSASHSQPEVGLSVERLERAFATPITPVAISPIYKLAVFFVALAMVALPLLYVALIGLSGYGVYYHLTAHQSMLEAGFWGTLLYVAVAVVGAILVLFMIKPLFAPRSQAEQPLELEPSREPQLFAFVEQLCRQVRAPIPRQIRVDHQANASASFRPGFVSFLRGDLVLTIGLPLSSSLSLRQLTGVLAHEFGHFAQSAGLRLSYVIRLVSLWFGRLVYERDAWDDRLKTWSEETDLRIGIFLFAARFFVWLTRKLLFLLMLLGHFLSSFLLRQMEYDADRYEIRIVGSKTFGETSRMFPAFAVAHQRALDLSQLFWSERKLADDFPALVAAQIDEMPDAVRDEIDKMLETERTGAFETHPATRDRIAAAERLDEAGAFDCDGPASLLFVDHSALCKRMTRDFYRQMLDEEVPEQNLLTVESLMAQRQSEEQDFDALRRFFQDSISVLRPLELPASLPQQSKARVERQLSEGRAQVMADVASRRRQFQRFDEADSRMIVLGQCQALLEAGFSFEPKVIGPRGSHPYRGGKGSRCCPTRSRLGRRQPLSARVFVDAALDPCSFVRLGARR
jgi:Zn-dependent protease with chaperone function